MKDKGNLTELIYTDLKNKIMDGELRGGQELNEKTLCEQYEVSKTPMKLAFYRLSADGLVDIIPNRGCYVREFTLGYIIEIMQVREVLEGKAAFLACNTLGVIVF